MRRNNTRATGRGGPLGVQVALGPNKPPSDGDPSQIIYIRRPPGRLAPELAHTAKYSLPATLLGPGVCRQLACRPCRLACVGALLTL